METVIRDLVRVYHYLTARITKLQATTGVVYIMILLILIMRIYHTAISIDVLLGKDVVPTAAASVGMKMILIVVLVVRSKIQEILQMVKKVFAHGLVGRSTTVVNTI